MIDAESRIGGARSAGRRRWALCAIGFAASLVASIDRAAAVGYEARVVDEHVFQVGRQDNLEVWVLPLPPTQEIGLWILVVNDGEESVEVYPERFRAFAVADSGKGPVRSRLRTYHPAQYEAIVRRRKHQFGSVQPAPAPSMASGRGDSIVGPKPGTNLKEACRNGVGDACTVRYGGRIGRTARNSSWNPGYRGNGPPGRGSDARFFDGYRPPESPDDSLLWPRRLPAHEWYGGVVYLKHKPGDEYHLSVPIAGVSYEFILRLPEPAAP